MKKCFFVSPIGAENSETRKRADTVYKYIIEPVCKECGFEPIRADKINEADTITQTIIGHLNNDEIVIADITEHNPNVFYEMGYRACTKKAMINLKDKKENIPFDIAAIRAFEYNLQDLYSVDEIKARITKTIESFNFAENDNSETTAEANDNLNGSDNLKILPLLYDIQDRIEQLRKDITNKDTDTIQAIVKASQSAQPADDLNTTIMKILLPELLKNPNSLNNLMEFANTISENESSDKRGRGKK